VNTEQWKAGMDVCGVVPSAVYVHGFSWK